MSRLLRTDEAEASLLNIGRYIARQSGSVERALTVLDRIDEKCKLYADHPRAGELREDLGLDVHCFPVDNYVVVYRPLQDGILVLLVAHGHQDIPELCRRLFWNS